MPTRPQSILQEVSQTDEHKQIDPSGHSGDSGTRLAWSCLHTHCKCPHMLQIPALHISMKIFSSTSSEPYICLQLDIMGHREAKPCQRDPREPREEPVMVLGSPKALSHGPLIPHPRTRRWNSPGASIPRNGDNGYSSAQAGSTTPWRNTLGSEMHPTEKHQPPPSHGGELPG